MVGGESIGRGLEGDAPGTAAQALTAILETQYLRYLIIASWAVAMWSTVGIKLAVAWFVATLTAGAVRGWTERRASRRERQGWALSFRL